jgi:hypothetical protein
MCTRVPVGRHGTDRIAVLFEQRREIERTVRVAPVIRATVGVDRAGQIPLLFEQHAEIANGPGKAARIRSTVGCFG